MFKQYSFAEVERHNKRDDLWVVIHNEIFDVTAFKEEHPGGDEVLFEYAGKDGSQAFEDADHSSDARELMKKYKVGEIVEAQRVSKVSSKGGKCGNNAKIKCLVSSVALGAVVVIIYCIYRARK